MSEEQKKQEAAEAVENKAAAQPEAAVEAKPSQPTASDLLSEDVGEIKVRKAKGSKNVYSGVCHINATFNNTSMQLSTTRKSLSPIPPAMSLAGRAQAK